MSSTRSTAKRPARRSTPARSAATAEPPATPEPARTAEPAEITEAAQPARAPRRRRPKLRGVAAVREALRASTTPVFFVGATPFNLLGLDRWVGRLGFISLIDPFDGAHPAVFAPSEQPSDALTSGVAVTNHLLRHPEVQAHLALQDGTPAITTVYADAETEQLCADLGYRLLVPSVADRERLEALVAPVEEIDLAARTITVALVVTRGGTVVGPYLSPLVGHAALTADPYAWCGDETFATVLTAERRSQVGELVAELGDRLAAEGFRGYAEAVVRIDRASASRTVVGLSLGIGAATSLSTTSAGAYADLPPYALHLLEQLGLDYELNVAELNQRWADLTPVDAQGQLIIRESGATPSTILDAPTSGRYVLDELGRAHLLAADLDWHGLVDESEFYLLRIARPGDVSWPGTDLAVLITKGRLQVGSQDGDLVASDVIMPPMLTARAQTMIDNVRRRYVDDSAHIASAAVGGW